MHINKVTHIVKTDNNKIRAKSRYTWCNVENLIYSGTSAGKGTKTDKIRSAIKELQETESGYNRTVIRIGS